MSTKLLSLSIGSTIVGIAILISVLAGNAIPITFANSSNTNTTDSQQLNAKITHYQQY
jgi:hypothetical protein